jgi:hypothetical protein
MVILIDDLDRCRPENVLEVLELVNFLVASGECFVIMGLDLERVDRCVGLGFREVAEELLSGRDDRWQAGVEAPASRPVALPGHPAAPTGDNAAAETGRKKRAAFARQYLEKLINIEVPVPLPSLEQSRELFAPQGQPQRRNAWGRRVAQVFELLGALWPVLCVVAVLADGVIAGASSTPGARSGSGDSQLQVASPADGPQRQEPVQHHSPGTVTSGVQDTPATVLVYGPLLLFLLLGVWRFSLRPAVVVKDSPEFVAALRLWHPMVVAKQNTPRALKRFLNRVRFYAMCQRPSQRPVPRWQRLFAWLRRRVGGRPQSPLSTAAEPPIPEALLVALSTIQHCYPEWLQDERLFTDFAGYLKTHEAVLPEEVKNALDAFLKGPPVIAYRRAFVQLSAGIRIS